MKKGVNRLRDWPNYGICSDGTVLNLKFMRIVKPWKHRNKERVTLWNDGKKTNIYVQDLMDKRVWADESI